MCNSYQVVAMHQCWVGKRSSEMGSTFRPGRGREYGENTWHHWVEFWKVHRVWIRRWVSWPQWGIELRETEMSHSFGKQCWETIFSLNTYWESVRHSKLNTKWELSDTQSDILFKNAGEFCLEHKWTSLADKLWLVWFRNQEMQTPGLNGRQDPESVVWL